MATGGEIRMLIATGGLILEDLVIIDGKVLKSEGMKFDVTRL